jgi:hypothetical protein
MRANVNNDNGEKRGKEQREKSVITSGSTTFLLIHWHIYSLLNVLE